MTARRWTILALAAAVLGLIGWDIIVATNDEPGDTISEIVLPFSTKHSSAPSALGVVLGHLFFPSRRESPSWSIAALAVLGVAATLLDVFGMIPDITPGIPLAVGAGLGHWLWPQRAPE